jgi:outer membrane protein assembly factor BamB
MNAQVIPIQTRAFRRALLLVFAACCLAHTLGNAQDAPKGLWLLARKDTQNTARADVPGNMRSAPKEVWRYGGDAGSYSFLTPVKAAGRDAYFAQIRSGLQVVRPDGSLLWNRPKLGVASVIAVEDFLGNGERQALVTLGATAIALFDVSTGAPRWTWTVPEGAFIGTYQIWRHASQIHLLCFPQNSVQGFCLDLRSRARQTPVVWQRNYTGYWQGYGPSIVLADMDNDGVDDVVLAGKPGYIAVIDAQNGDIKFDIHHDITGGDHTGRPYGLLVATDIDGDGYKDVAVLSCQVEEYVTILHNDHGKRLVPLWSQFVQQQLPDDSHELRPNVTSLVDLHGDGKKELVVGLYDIADDNRWHTVVIDPNVGFQARLVDLPDRYFWGCYDLRGDGHPQIVTSTEKSRKVAASTTVQAVDGRTFRDIATLDHVSLDPGAERLPKDIAFMAIRTTPFYARPSNGPPGILLHRAADATPQLWRLQGDKSVFTPMPISSVSRMVVTSHPVDVAGRSDIGRADRVIAQRGRNALAATAPLVGYAHGSRELVLALSNDTVLGGEPDLKASGKFKRSWTVPGSMPALWIGSQGERIVCTVDNEKILLSRPAPGSAAAPPPTVITPPFPIYRHGATRSGATLLPFGTEKMRLFAGLQTGIHTMASALYDEDGKPLWVDDKEGPYPRTAAAAQLGDANFRLLVDNHGKQFIYNVDGSNRLIAHGWNDTVPGRSNGAKYAVPIVGPFGAHGETRVIMAPGLQTLEVLDAQGARLAKRDYASSYEFEWCGSAVAQTRGAGQWDVGIANQAGIFHCVDAITCRTRWTFDLGTHAAMPFNIVSADIDGDGRDEFLVGTPTGDLFALNENGDGHLLWKMTFEYGIREAIVADVDGDGLAEIVVELEDGSIHILKGASH